MSGLKDTPLRQGSATANGVASQGREFCRHRAHFWFIKAVLANLLCRSISDRKQPIEKGKILDQFVELISSHCEDCLRVRHEKIKVRAANFSFPVLMPSSLTEKVPYEKMQMYRYTSQSGEQTNQGSIQSLCENRPQFSQYEYQI
jgi:hypothetical protein